MPATVLAAAATIFEVLGSENAEAVFDVKITAFQQWLGLLNFFVGLFHSRIK